MKNGEWFAIQIVPGSIAVLLFILGTMSCATIVSGTQQEIHFDSRPRGATATVDGQSFKTPADVKLSRKHTYDVSIEKPGYIPSRRRIFRKTNSAVWGNVLIGGMVGLLIDMSSGAYYDLDPDHISVTLIEDPSSELSPKSSNIGPSPVEAPIDEARDTKPDPDPD